MKWKETDLLYYIDLYCEQHNYTICMKQNT